jgi:hypothetical protein
MFVKKQRDAETFKRAVCMGIQLGSRMGMSPELLGELLKSLPQVNVP